MSYITCLMSSVGLSGLSNISNDTLQGRYEKALKQINKLIEINRQLKQRVSEYQTEITNCNQQIQALQQANHELDQESNILDSKYMELNSHYEELEVYCKNLEEQLNNNHLNSQEADQHIKEVEAKYQQDLENQMDKYNALAKESEYIQHGYQESLTTIQKHEQDQKELLKQLESLRKQNQDLKASNAKLTETVTQKHIVQIEGQLDQANKNIERLIKECNDLKSKQIDFEVFEEKQKVQKYIGLSTSINDQQGDAVKQLIQQYKRKIKQLQNEKKEVQQKYKNLKLKISRMQNAQNYQKKIESLERLTEKQQREIARIIQTYDHELNSIYRQNVKIREAYISLSQALSKKGYELGEKEKAITELKMTSDRISFENESLRKVNSNLLEEKQNKLKELSILKDKIHHTESITIGHMKSTSDNVDGSNEKIKMKISQIQKGLYSVPSNMYTKDEPFITTSFNAKEEKRNIPITVSYSSPNSDKGDFKFIQSVNIINGYNVSLGENTGRSSNQ